MKKNKKKIALETKVDLILLIIGVFILIWVVVTHEEVRKGYVYTANSMITSTEVVESVSNLERLNIDGRMEERLQEVISQELSLIDVKVKILSQNNFDDSIIATFMYKVEDESYEGIVQMSSNDEVLFKVVDKINKQEPFTLHEIEFRKENIPACNVIYGVINTPIIKSININFNDAKVAHIVLGENINYTYIQDVKASPIIRVDGLDEKLNVFYKWEKIYMKPI